MEIKIDETILDHVMCLEPEIGEAFLPRYPELLSAEEKELFEIHLRGCQLCQERLKLWQAMGLSLHVEALVKRAKALFAERRYGEALEAYNQAMDRDPSLSELQPDLEFFQSANPLPLTAAWSKNENIMPYLDREAEVLAAAKTTAPFPLTVEYADGQVKGTFTTAGPAVFFELLEVHEGFEAGLLLIGRLLQPTVKLKIWKIEQTRKKQRLGTLDALFGSADFSAIIHAVSTFSVFPMENSRDEVEHS